MAGRPGLRSALPGAAPRCGEARRQGVQRQPQSRPLGKPQNSAFGGGLVLPSVNRRPRGLPAFPPDTWSARPSCSSPSRAREGRLPNLKANPKGKAGRVAPAALGPQCRRARCGREAGFAQGQSGQLWPSRSPRPPRCCGQCFLFPRHNRSVQSVWASSVHRPLSEQGPPKSPAPGELGARPVCGDISQGCAVESPSQTGPQETKTYSPGMTGEPSPWVPWPLTLPPSDHRGGKRRRPERWV